MNISIRNIDKQIWKEAKAQAQLQGNTIGEWLDMAIKGYIASESVLRKRLPEQAKCEMCGKIVYKGRKGHNKMIVHHDEPNNRTASVAKILCSKCHIGRHHELGWGIPYSKSKREQKATRSGKFRCSLCRTWYPVSARAPVEVKAHTRLCLYCWRDRKEEASEFLKPLRNWNEKRGRPPKKVIYPVSNTIRDGERL